MSRTTRVAAQVHRRVPSAVSSRRRPRSSAQPRLAAAPSGLVYRSPPPWKPSVPDFSHDQSEAISVDGWSLQERGTLPLRPVEPRRSAAPVPPLEHGLDAVLREKGVHPVVAVRTSPDKNSLRTFSPHVQGLEALSRIAQPEEINWAGIPPYIRASQDANLREMTKGIPSVRYSGSTSSMTTVLSTLYHALANFRDTRLMGGLSEGMRDLPSSFTKHHTKPIAIAVRPYPFGEGGATASRPIFSVDSHDGIDSSPAILRDLGHSMERMLTMSSEEFREKMLRPDGPAPPLEKCSLSYMDVNAGSALAANHEPQFYNYSQIGPFLVRAQIDCRDPSTGDVFDLKTRAVAAVRYNISEYKSKADQTLQSLTGVTQSYEREFYDMVRSVFLKYALQLRIGRMSGAFVTYHNTTRVLGFEFLSLREMEAYVFGLPQWADLGFSFSVRTLGIILDTLTSSMPVEHPGYLKVAFVPRSSQRALTICVQRVHGRGKEDDPLHPSKFSYGQSKSKKRRMGILETTSESGDLGALEDAKEDFQDCTRAGFAHVGMHSASSMLPLRGPSNAKNANGNDLTYGDMRTLQRNRLAREANIASGDVQTWVLHLLPVLNGAPTRQPFEFSDGDSFELRYKLTKKSDDHPQMLRECIQALDETYNA